MIQLDGKPVFIMASERSGTNLLRKRITDAQDRYLGASPAHFLKNLYFQEPYYGDLANNDNFLLMVEDALGLCLKHFSPWKIDWKAEQIVEQIPDGNRSAVALMHYMCTRYAQENGYQDYICKDNFLYEFAVDIAATIPGALFIYLYRDPRDFVLSQMKRPGAVQSCARFSNLWAYEQTRAITMANKLGRENRCISVSYEEFISDESGQMNRILDFLGVRKGSAIKYSEEHKDEVHEWNNLSRETMSQNQNKYASEMSASRIAMVEGICHKQMRHLGYEMTSKEVRSPSRAMLYLDYLRGTLLSRMRKNRNAEKESVIERQKLLQRLAINYRCDN